MVAFCGSNLMPNISGETKIETQATLPNRRFIIHFDDVYTWLVPGQTMNVAAILYEQDGTIEFQVDKILLYSLVWLFGCISTTKIIPCLQYSRHK